MPEFIKPTLEYVELLPLLIVFGTACVGVIVEAFVPREHRRVPQLAVTLIGLAAALAATIWIATDLEEHTGAGDQAARGLVGAEGSIIIDGPTVYLWGLLLVFGIFGAALFAERRLEGGLSAFAGQAAALPGTEAERLAATKGLDHTEVYPLLLFAVGGMLMFPASGDLLTMFVALEVLSLPLYLLCGLARRRRLLSQEAAL
jgi:NADH-quinone oxidoreductase subunit N